MKVKERKNTVFLFGAGAVIPWGAPTTTEITNMVLDAGFFTTDNKTRITRFIYQTLLENKFDEKDINFETIINVIEELIVYYSPFDANKKIPSLLTGFLSSSFEEIIFNYSITGGEAKHNYTIEIPKGIPYEGSKRSQHDETPHQFFLMHLLGLIIFEINVKISKYAYHTKVTQRETVDSALSNDFAKWMLNIHRKSNIRMYTLNYDRLFKILLEHAGLEVFEGYECRAEIDYDNQPYRANIPRILTDFDSPVHYNLHGCTYWNAEGLDKNQLPNPEMVLNGWPNVAMGHQFAFTQVEKGKTIMVSNIVTGYQKAQKSILTPVKQMQAAFDRDCCFADEIFVVGYSLGDEHINESIKTAMRHNDDLLLTFIDPNFTNDVTDFTFAVKFAPYRKSGNMRPYTLEPNYTHTFFDGIIMVHTMGFEEYLKMANDPMEKYRLKRPDKNPLSDRLRF